MSVRWININREEMKKEEVGRQIRKERSG